MLAFEVGFFIGHIRFPLTDLTKFLIVFLLISNLATDT